jgi:hypothetical protein
MRLAQTLARARGAMPSRSGAATSSSQSATPCAALNCANGTAERRKRPISRYYLRAHRADNKIIEFPSVSFTIESLVWNESGTHLALVGKSDVAVLAFPRLGLASPLKSESIPPKSSTCYIDLQ